MSKRLTIEFVKKQFEKEGYRLLNKEYINAHKKVDYICSNGHKHSIRWNDWRAGYRCPYCAGNVKLTVDFIRKEFEKENCILLTNKYKNNYKKLEYVCENGHLHKISWHNWMHNNNRCSHCSGNRKLNIKFIKREFEKEGYKLLSKIYKNSQTKLRYECPKGHKHSMVWGHWQQNRRCPSCKVVNMSGKNHPNWKGGISCEPYCHEWSFKEFKDYIKERDGNKCLNPDCFGNIYRLCVHHIDYNKKNCGPENLITLCTSCNSRANKDREWHTAWYQAILYRRTNTHKGE